MGTIPGSRKPAQRDAKRVRAVDPGLPIEITLDLRAPALPEPAGGRALTHEELADAHRANPEDAERVARVLHRYGMRIDEVSLETHSMRVSGSAAAMEEAFRPGLGVYVSAAEGEFRGREGDYRVPAELDGIILGIYGLDERRVARRSVAAGSPAAASTSFGLGPADIESRYNFPPGDGEGQQIAIAEFGSGTFRGDLETYCAQFGRPVPKVWTVDVGTPPPLQYPSVELSLDVQLVAGLCPKAEIFVYFAQWTEKGWIDLLNKVISGKPAKPVTLSISWSWAEDSGWSVAALSSINNRLKAAALLGITVCVASGDDGSGAQMNDTRAHVEFPSCSPYVLCVGGTMLAGNGEEVTWYEDPGQRPGGAPGGGKSIKFSRPRWQNVRIASINNDPFDGRVIPDVAALAGSPRYAVVVGSADQQVGGTSGAAPVWAALLARINAQLPAARKQRFLTPLLYSSIGGYPLGSISSRNVRTGHNNASMPLPGKGYAPLAGYDAVTGWGVPDGRKLLRYLSLKGDGGESKATAVKPSPCLK